MSQILTLILLGIAVFRGHSSDSPADVPATAEYPDDPIESIQVCADGTTGTCDMDSVRVSDSDEPSFGTKLLNHYTKYRAKNPHLFSDTPTTAQGIRVENPNTKSYDKYWFDEARQVGIFQGRIKPRGVTATNSYEGHIFYFTEQGTDNEVFRFRTTPGQSLYIIPPENEEIEESQHYKDILEKQAFIQDYYKKNGRPWLSSYPRGPRELFNWPCDYVGQIHKVVTPHNYWYCETGNPLQGNCEWKQMEGNLEFKVEVINLEPRMLAIENTLSMDEADMVIQMSKDRIKRSRVGTDGGMDSETRTSENTWLTRHSHFVINNIYRRTADILNLEPTFDRNFENLQVLHYSVGQEYKAHHDFGDHGKPQHRAITLLFFLNNQVNEHSGGATAFPHANNGLGVQAHPGKGNSVMFYGMGEDGNCDEKTLHEATRIVSGEKWLCNFWIWDPHR